MKVEVTDISPVKKSMTIHVDADEVAKERESLIRGYAREAKLPGFRPGKAPLDLIRKRFAKEMDDDLRDRLLNLYHRKATTEHELRPIADPVVDEVGEAKDGEPFVFKTTFEVLPAFELKDYEGVEVRRPSPTVGEADVDKALEEIRESRTQLVTEEGRLAEEGDVVVVDVHGEPAGGEPFDRERMMIEVGAKDNLPAFNEKLPGSGAGGTIEFPVEYPDDYPAEHLRGATVAYRLTVHEVKKKVLPELDDEFAKDLGDFEDLAALRARIRDDLESHRKAEIERDVRQKVLEKVLTANPVVLPDTLVEDEIRHRLEEFVRRLMMQGVDPEKANIDWKEARERQDEPARKSVHARLVLDALAEKAGVTVTPQEVEERLRREAHASGQSVGDLKKRLQEGPGLQVLRLQMVREKSLDLLTSVANIQNEE